MVKEAFVGHTPVSNLFIDLEKTVLNETFLFAKWDKRKAQTKPRSCLSLCRSRGISNKDVISLILYSALTKYQWTRLGKKCLRI